MECNGHGGGTPPLGPRDGKGRRRAPLPGFPSRKLAGRALLGLAAAIAVSSCSGNWARHAGLFDEGRFAEWETLETRRGTMALKAGTRTSADGPGESRSVLQVACARGAPVVGIMYAKPPGRKAEGEAAAGDDRKSHRRHRHDGGRREGRPVTVRYRVDSEGAATDVQATVRRGPRKVGRRIAIRGEDAQDLLRAMGDGSAVSFEASGPGDRSHVFEFSLAGSAAKVDSVTGRCHAMGAGLPPDSFFGWHGSPAIRGVADLLVPRTTMN